MTLRAMRFDPPRWGPVLDLRDIVHHGTPLTKKEARYVFRLAGAIRAVVPCGECGVPEGAWCARKVDGQPMANHSSRVQQARRLFEHRILPQLHRMHRTLCSDASNFITFGSVVDQAVDCMSCLVAATRQR